MVSHTILINAAVVRCAQVGTVLFLASIILGFSCWSNNGLILLKFLHKNPGQPIQKTGFWLSSRPFCIRTTFIWVHQGPPIIVLTFFWNCLLNIWEFYVVTNFRKKSELLLVELGGPKWGLFLYRRVYWITRTPAFLWVGLDCIFCWTIWTNWEQCAKPGFRIKYLARKTSYNIVVANFEVH